MRLLQVKLSHKSYPLYIKRGILRVIGEEVKKMYSGKKVVIVTDENVDKFYGDMVKSSLENAGFEVFKIVVKPGEKSKSIEELINLYDELLDTGITREELIVALGGGVIGDLTGFAASTLFRGFHMYKYQLLF